MARTLIQQSGEVVATVTAEKLGTIAPFIVAPIDKITHIITEKQVADEVLAPYILQGVRVLKTS